MMNAVYAYINKKDTSKLFVINQIKRLDVSYEKSTSNLQNGVVVTNSRLNPKNITISFTICDDYIPVVDMKDKIIDLFKESGNEVIFSDTLNKKIICDLVNINFEEITQYLATGTIELFNPTGLEYFANYITTSASFDENGQLKATVNNQGTVQCPINYRIKFESTCSYVGIVSEKGAIQVGAKNANYVNNDNDIRKLVIADDAINDTFNKNWTKGGGYPSSPFPTTNGWGRISKDGRWFMYPTNYGSGSSYHGASMWRKFSPDASGSVGSKDFEVEGRLFFLNSNGKEQGLQEVIISDSDGNTKIGFSINKPSDGNQAKIQLYNGETSAHIDIDTGANKYVDWSTGAFRIKKVGRDVTFSFNARANINYHVTSIDNVIFDTVTLYGAQIANRPTMARLWFEYIRVWRLKSTTTTESTPTNIFSKGDTLVIDGETGKAYHNEVLISDINGSVWFDADVGQTDIYFYYSNYAAAPKITCEVMPRWK